MSTGRLGRASINIVLQVEGLVDHPPKRWAIEGTRENVSDSCHADSRGKIAFFSSFFVVVVAVYGICRGECVYYSVAVVYSNFRKLVWGRIHLNPFCFP